MIRLALTFILMLSFRTFGAAWYLDSAAVGSNNGTNWANAWQNPTNVVWGASGVKAGDTMYVSGGSSLKQYSDNIVFAASGSNGAPITLQISRDSGHNGVAWFPAININTRTWIVVDGERSTGFVPYTNTWLLVSNQPNMGILASRTNGPGIYVEGAGGANNRIRWTEVGPIGTTNDIGTCDGLKLNNLDVLTNFVVEYCYFHHIQDDGINHNSTATQPTTWDAIQIRYTAIHYVGDDAIQSTCAGWTYYHYDSRWHWYPLYNGHPDKIQFSGQANKYLKVVNCVLGNSGNSLIIGEHLIADNGVIGPILIAGNILANTRESETNWYQIQAYGATFDAWRENTAVSATNGTFTNFFFLNNTVYWQRNTPFKMGRAAPDGATRSVWDLRVKDSRFQNNLFLDCKYNSPGDVYSAVSINGDGDDIGGTNGVYYSTNDYVVSHNVVNGVNQTMTYHGVQGSNATVHGNNNSASRPLIETNNYTFVLDATDTVAKDAGISLVALTNQFPELMRDIAGNVRGTGAGWDIGAMEYSSGLITNGLIVRITFDTPPSNSAAGYEDTSGFGHHALAFGFGDHQSVSNRTPQPTNWVHPVRGTTESGIVFTRYPDDGWDEYDASGDYLAITNRLNNNLWSMPQATFTWWGRWMANPTNTSGASNYNATANRTWICGGYGYPGAWKIGVEGDRFTTFQVYTNTSANSDVYTRFGDAINGSTVPYGNSTNWHFYSMTWSNGYTMTWSNGVPFRTNQLYDGSIGGGAFLTNLTVRGPAGTLAGFFGIGVDNHNGKPWLIVPGGSGLGDDGDGSTFEMDGGKQLPNHGWAGWASMDDLRVYNRVLSGEEILQIYNGDESGGSPGGGGGGGGEEGGGSESSSGKPSIQAVNAIIGRITGP